MAKLLTRTVGPRLEAISAVAVGWMGYVVRDSFKRSVKLVQ